MHPVKLVDRDLIDNGPVGRDDGPLFPIAVVDFALVDAACSQQSLMRISPRST